MTSRFEDKVVVVTGAARGIGFAAASMFATEEARVVINDLNADAVQAAVERLEARGARAIGIACDVQRPGPGS